MYSAVLLCSLTKYIHGESPVTFCRVESGNLCGNTLSALRKSGCVPCHFCEQMFENLSMRKAHENLHLGTPLQCSVCGQLFPHKSKLDRHMWVHSDDKVQCQQCKRKFNSPNSLSSHQYWSKSCGQKLKQGK